MKKYKIAWLPGDGIGEEVGTEALRVLKCAGEVHQIDWEVERCSIGAEAMELEGVPYPDKTHEVCMDSDAVLFGAVGLPKYDHDPTAKMRPEQGLLDMRSRLGLFANIRPFQLYPTLKDHSPIKEERLKNVDFICVRELTGGLYFGQPQGRSEDGNRAFDSCVYTRSEVYRILQIGFEYAQKRRKKLTLIDKANVLATSRLWRQVAKELAKKYTDVDVEYLFIDRALVRLITDPSRFDVVVSDNMFGDIFSNAAGAISGSSGLLPSASAGRHTPVFEPVHGSYPEAKGLGVANPVGAILSGAMLLDFLGQSEAAKNMRTAVEHAIVRDIVTPDLLTDSTCTTQQVGKWIAQHILDKN